MKTHLLAVAAFCLAAVGLAYEPPAHTNSFTRAGVTYAQRGGLGVQDYVVTNVSMMASDIGAVADDDDYNSVKSKATTAVQPNAIADMETKTHAENTYQPKGEYLTEETDPNVKAWAKAETKPSYNASEVGALPDNQEQLEANENFKGAVATVSPPVELPEKWALSNVTNANGVAADGLLDAKRDKTDMAVEWVCRVNGEIDYGAYVKWIEAEEGWEVYTSDGFAGVTYSPRDATHIEFDIEGDGSRIFTADHDHLAVASALDKKADEFTKWIVVDDSGVRRDNFRVEWSDGIYYITDGSDGWVADGYFERDDAVSLKNFESDKRNWLANRKRVIRTGEAATPQEVAGITNADNIAIGQSSRASRSFIGQVAIGREAHTSQNRAVAIGRSAMASNSNSIAIGYNAKSHGANTFNVPHDIGNWYAGDMPVVQALQYHFVEGGVDPETGVPLLVPDLTDPVVCKHDCTPVNPVAEFYDAQRGMTWRLDAVDFELKLYAATNVDATAFCQVNNVLTDTVTTNATRLVVTDGELKFFHQ